MNYARLILACATLIAASSAPRADAVSTPSSPALRPHPATLGVGLEVNRLLRRSRARTLQPAEVSAGISRAGTAVLAPAMLILEERVLPPIDGAAPQILSEPQEAQLLEALRALPPHFVLDAARAHLEHQGAEHASLAARMAVVRAVGTCGRYASLSWLCGLIADDGAHELEAGIERTLASSAREILRRDPDGTSALAFDWYRLPRIAVPAIVSAAGADGDPRALPMLGEVLMRRPDLARLTLSELARQRAPDGIPRALLDDLRERLTTAQPMECRSACNALAALGDFGAAAKLVELLGAPDDGLRATAHQALQTLSATQLPVEISGWRCWLAKEQSWYESNETALEGALDSDSVPDAMGALAEIAEHAWERHHMSELVARALQRSENRTLQLRACQVLRLLSSPRARKALETAAKSDDAELSAAALSALSALPQSRDARASSPVRE
jgi:hypothetical protein